MRAHEIGKDSGVIINTISVESLDFKPGLIDADLHGGTIGDFWNGKQVVPAERPEPVQPSYTLDQIVRVLLKNKLVSEDDLKI